MTYAYPTASPLKLEMDRLDAWWTAQEAIVWYPDANRVLGDHCWGAYKPEPQVQRACVDRYGEEED